MNEKLRALRLADALEGISTSNADSLLAQMTARSAAAELRRLHEVSQELWEALEDALHLIVTISPIEGATVRKARSAIEKATGETK